jgi:DNA-binding GntR family transcriptional regulator
VPSREQPQESSLIQQAYQAIRQQILDCVLAPGLQVSERTLASGMGLTIASVRGALGRLASDGLVESVPRVGYRISPITLRGVNDFFEAWTIIGPAIVRLAVSRATAADRDNLARLAAKPPGENATQEIANSEEIWAVIVSAAGNTVLADLYRRMNSDMHRLFIQVYRAQKPDEDRNLELRSLVDLQPDEAAEVTRVNIERVRERVMETVLGASSLADYSVTFP